MKRVFDELPELQLQEYDFAGPERQIPALSLCFIAHEEEEFEQAMDAIVNRH